ncbi:MAG TPA: hypothetical protein VK795_05220 [Terriglobales bacterium]|jgi:hypothetical protein|nr:hypothetical protein [Terriglobales bacterium]
MAAQLDDKVSSPDSASKDRIALSKDLCVSEQNNGLARTVTDQPAAPEAEKNPQKLKPQRVDLTPEEPVNIGFVGGIWEPKK